MVVKLSGVKTMEGKVRHYTRGGGGPSSRLAGGASSMKLHRNPCLRFAAVAGAEAVYWSSFASAGLLALALLIFFALLFLGPYLTFTLLLYKLTPWSKSSPNQGIGFLLFLGSVFLIFSGYRLFVKYPQLRNMDNLSKIELIPVVFQIGIYYAFLSFCSLLGSLLTFDILMAFYWTWSAVFYGFLLFYLMTSVIPWYYLLLSIVFLPLVITRLIPRVRDWQTSSAADDAAARVDYANFSKNLRLRSSLPV